jgi:hypothetical protein
VARSQLQHECKGADRLRPVRATIALLLLLPQLTGCYHYVPATTSTLPNGTRVSLGLTDPGRVALADAVGPGVRRIEGQILTSTDTAVVLSVLTVQHVDLNVPVKWRGERVAISRNFVSDVSEWRLSKGRSWLLAGLIVVGAAVASTIAITGFGSDPGSDKPGNGEPGTSTVVPGIQR